MIAVSPSDTTESDFGLTRWILIIIREAQQRHTLRTDLEGAGFAVEVASDTSAALDCLAVMTPALIVVDENFDDQDAGRLLRELKKRQPGASVPVLTSWQRRS